MRCQSRRHVENWRSPECGPKVWESKRSMPVLRKVELVLKFSRDFVGFE
jgi:hypothetical protein